ncbi:leucine-rich repeat and WD repeat-containing protein 1 isoform X2 [Globicephala melas]|uniref:leucine-rich repeat and WD repeat-containing protein 1 isoform X2 n=1 Tax=Globicephala melas TaxID=9731 RepID=UPI00293D4D3B|nr:leucine-rich repeat and WD repeat-containing protein 1 isoform X2 [Globicephala melas]
MRWVSLSGMNLLSEHLDPKLLSRLKQLQELDLSNNQLETLPANLGLSHLRILRCANNQLGDVTVLCQFPQLEELSLEGNPFLTVSDNLKVSFLLPKLRKVNGKDASSTCSQVENLNRELTSRVTAHWEKFMAALSPEEEAEKAQADFVRSAVRDVRYGPESLSDFTQWRVRMISEELVASGGTQVHEANISERPPKATTIQEPRVSGSMGLPGSQGLPWPFLPREALGRRPGSVPRRWPSLLELVPSDPGTPGLPYPWESAVQPLMGRKEALGRWTHGHQALGLPPPPPPQAGPVASKRPGDGPVNLSPNKRVCTSPLAQVEGSPVGSAGSQTALQLEPLHFLQCHSKNNSPRDLETQLWACAFEPAWDEGQAGATSQTVATCGGEAVCVIDCQTGIVLHKYKAPSEEFFSVAWTALTVVTQAGHKKRWSVLAAAGLRGLVRLLHVRAGFCCGLIRAHKKAIATLCFSPTHETHLFTASYDKRIILWDIGVPNHDYEFQASQLLTLDTTSIALRLCPVASCPDAYLLAGCEGGCRCWDVRLDQPQKRRVCEVEFVFSEGSEATGRRVDGLAFVNEDVVASKGSSLGTICLWSWSQTWQGRGSQSTVAVVVLARLQWSPTELAYFSLSTCPGEGMVLCGDEEGNVWIYDVRPLVAQRPPPPATPQAPTQILKWPQPRALGQTVSRTMVNTVVADPTFTYLTALTDSNIVAIWRRNQP